MASSSTAPSAEVIAQSARSAFETSQLLDASERDDALFKIRDLLLARRDDILAANQKDLDVRYDAQRHKTAEETS
jgi:gamma-glutamyl phosphate reductase